METITIKQATTGTSYFEANTRFGTMSRERKEDLVMVMEWVFGKDVEILTELAEITNRHPFPAN